MSLIEATLSGFAQPLYFPPEITDNEEVFCNSNNRDIIIRIEAKPIEDLEKVVESNVTVLDIVIHRESKQWDCKIRRGGEPIVIAPGGSKRRDNYVILANGPGVDVTYLLKACALLGNMIYIPSFRNTINAGSASYYDIPVGQGFITQWNIWKTGSIKQYQETAYKVQKDLAKIFAYSELEINASTDGKSLHMIINGKSYKSSELGSGLTQFFLVLGSVAIRSYRPSFILIDEPEINLHPSLQLDFLTRLTSYADFGILFATHSIGLARASADYIYSVRRNADNLSEITDYNSTPRLTELLGELSFAGYRELGFNKILLVEGATEIKTIQQFLRWYKKEHKIVLLPMGGDQMINPDAGTQLEEIKRISKEIFILIDSERSSEDEELSARRAAFKKICEDINITCHILERRAMENYFPDHAIKKVKGKTYHALKAYEHFKSGPSFSKWAKSENWQIAQEMVRSDLDGTDLGQFLQSL